MMVVPQLEQICNHGYDICKYVQQMYIQDIWL